jgi:hypothetical protein
MVANSLLIDFPSYMAVVSNQVFVFSFPGKK